MSPDDVLIPLAALLLVPTGVAVLTFTTTANSTVQLGSAPHVRGRVMALYVLVFMGGTPIGAPLIGALAEAFGPRSSIVFGGAVVAGSANLLNLLDLRPGRALKAGAAAALLLGQPGPGAAAVALLPDDLHERTMLGDAGANGLGALLGLAVLRRAPQRRGVALAVLVALTAASEVVSYSRVIDAVPLLRQLLQL